MRKNYHNITLTDEVESYVKQYMSDKWKKFHQNYII